MDLSTEEGFQEAFELYFDRVYYYFRWRLNIQNDLAYDLTQETFLRVFKSRDTFRGESRLDTWILQIARNIGLNEIRSRATLKREGAEVSLMDEAGFPLSIPDEKAPEPLGLVLEDERARKLRGALDELPPQMRRCVELRLNQDLKYREIADLLGISIETVKAHLFQARQQLREKLSDYFTEIDP
jgi:RNA polymerase sigma-70 factor (ECF subfamily)